jgi:peptide/nickel transport system permease protein
MTSFRRYLLRRIFHSLVTVWVIATLIFLLIRLAPGDATAYLVDPSFPPDIRADILRRYGLDKPIWQQYVAYMANLARGDLGLSFFSQKPVLTAIGEQFWNTIALSLAAFIIAYTLGTVGGAYLAYHRGTPKDTLGVTLALIFRSAPVYWTGMIALSFLAYQLNWFPSGRMRSVGYEAANAFEKYFSLDFLHHLALPAVIAGLYFAALPMLLVRNAVIEVLNEDFVELARAKGLSKRRVIIFHALRNALLPLVTSAAIYIGLALGGITVIEVVFSWPGLGREIISSVQRHDYPMAQGAFLLLAVMVSLMNLVADMLYARLDPRITYS